MYAYIEQLYDILNMRDNHITIMVVYIALHVLALLLRVFSYLAWNAGLVALRFNTKDIKARDDIKKIRYGPLLRIAAEYIRVAERSVSRIPTSAIVERQVSSMSLLGWRYVSIQPFVEALESGLVFVGLILAVVFNEQAFVYGGLAAAGFVLVRLVAAFFDFRTAQRIFTDELLIYTEREIGQFFAADAGSVVLRWKSELTEALAKQSQVLKTAIEALSTGLTDSIAKNLIDMNAALDQPIKEWAKTLSEAERVQGLYNVSGERLTLAGSHLQSASDLLAKHLQNYSNALSDQLGGLVSAVDAVRESNAMYAANHEAFLKEAKYIERNQAALETSLQSYETALQKLTQSLGDGLGVYTHAYAQEATQSVNEALQSNIDRILGSNQETLTRMAALFDQLRDQSRDISAHLLSIHEKMGDLDGNR